MKDLEPSAFGIGEQMGADRPEMKFAWKSAIRELQRIPEAQTPRQKLLLIGRAIEIIQHSFTLYLRGTQINADDIVTVLPYLLVKAKVNRLLAHTNYIEAFHYSTSEGD
jgi:Vacuolar sorting protein 9 (VPS9) domain